MAFKTYKRAHLLSASQWPSKDRLFWFRLPITVPFNPTEITLFEPFRFLFGAQINGQHPRRHVRKVLFITKYQFFVWCKITPNCPNLPLETWAASSLSRVKCLPNGFSRNRRCQSTDFWRFSTVFRFQLGGPLLKSRSTLGNFRWIRTMSRCWNNRAINRQNWLEIDYRRVEQTPTCFAKPDFMKA